MTEAELLQKYYPLVKSRANKFRTTTVVDREDLVQIGNMALLSAFRDYDDKIGKFTTLADKYIKNALINNYHKEKRIPRYRRYAARERDCEQYWEFLPDTLTELEQLIVQLLYSGYSRLEIADLLKVSMSSISKKVNNIKGKVKTFYG